MKRENILLVLAFTLMLVVSIALMGIQSTLPTSEVDKMFGQKVSIVNEKPVIDANIMSQADVLDLFGNKIADIYVTRTNNSYFYLELYVAIDANGKVYAIDKKVETYDSTSASYFPLVREYLLKNYGGLYFENVQFVDGAAGASTIEVSRSAIKNIISHVITFHIGEPVDYIKDMFGGDYLVQSTETISGIKVTTVLFGGETYKVYEHTKEGSYFDRQTTHMATVTVVIALDDAKVIRYGILPDELYNHTHGRFITASKEFLTTFIGLNINASLPESTTGPTENSKGTQYLIRQIIDEIKEVAWWIKS